MNVMGEWIKLIEDDGSLRTINTQTVANTKLYANGFMEVDCMQVIIKGRYMGTDIIYGDGQDKFLQDLLSLIGEKLGEEDEEEEEV